jgi:uncharacterized coiled-coil DUF342 family protein
METARQNLNQLIAQLDSTFPEDSDLKGFSGISKVVITDSLTQSSALLVTLKEFDNSFDAIILKRNLANLFAKIQKELKEPFDKITAEKFNDIIRLISHIRTSIRETYMSLVNSVPLRTEAELIKAKEELDSLTNSIEQIIKTKQEIDSLKESVNGSLKASETSALNAKDSSLTLIAKINDLVEESKSKALLKITELTAELVKNEKSINKTMTNVEAKLKKLTDSEQQTDKFVSEIETRKTSIDEVNKNVIQWKTDISSISSEIKKLSIDYTELNSKSNSLKAEIETNFEKLVGKKDAEGKITKAGYLQETEQLKTKLTEFLKEIEKKSKAQFIEIEGLLPGATSAGLAEAYQKQKLSYTWPMRLWSWVFIVTMSGMAGFSIYLLTNQLEHPAPAWNDALIALLRDIPFFIPTIWLAAYASKQQSQYKRLQQEYAFKETNAKSFHGHKVQIEELVENSASDDQLLNQLVAQLVLITAQNPSVTLDNKSHDDSPPIFKLLEKYMPSVKKTNPPKVES